MTVGNFSPQPHNQSHAYDRRLRSRCFLGDDRVSSLINQSQAYGHRLDRDNFSEMTGLTSPPPQPPKIPNNQPG